MAFALTEEQSRAVHDRGGGLLVSAAAGSGKTRVLVAGPGDRGGSGYRRLPGHYIYPGGCGRAAGPDCSGAVRPAGGAAQRPAPAAADHVGLQGPDLHGARLLCRSAAGERPPDRVGPGLSAVRRGGGPGCWGRPWTASTRIWTRRGTLPPWWTPWPPGGTTAAWSRSCWTCSAASRATRTRRAGWQTRAACGSWMGSPTRGTPPGGRCCWPTPGGRGSAAWSCCSGRWNSPAGTACSARITAPVSPSPSRGCGPCWRRTAGTACTGPCQWSSRRRGGKRAWRTWRRRSG